MRRLRVLLALISAVSLTGALPVVAAASISSKIESVVFTDASNGYLSGGYYVSDRVGFVSRTTDGGATWSAFAVPTKWMYGVDAFSASNAWTVSDYADQAWWTADGGTSWGPSNSMKGPLQSASMSAMDVAQLSANEVVAVGEQLSSNPSGDNLATVWRTADGGATWGEQWSGPQDVDPATAFETKFEAVDASSDGSVLFAVGGGKRGTVVNGELIWSSNLEPLIISSEDRGATWTQMTLPASTDRLEDVAVLSTTKAWAVGNTTVMKTVDGSTWQSVTLPSPFDSSGVAGWGEDHVAIVGAAGKVAVSIDGGTSWQPVMTMGNLLGLNGVAWLDDTHLVVVGDNQLVARIELNADGSLKAKSEYFTVNGSYPAPPAVKNPAAVTLTVPATSYYGSAKLTGYLKTGASAVSGKYVFIQQYVSGAWKTIGKTTSPTTTSGYFSYTASPTVKATYRAYFAGDSEYVADYSDSAAVTPRVRLTRTTSWSTCYRYRTYYATGYIEPRHFSTSGRVTIRAYKRASNGLYYYTKSFTSYYTSYTSTKTKYTAKVYFTSAQAGTWKLVAYHAGDSTNAATYGTADYITVK